MLWLVALALILRLAALMAVNMHHPDEFYQYPEQAYRLLTGQGVIPWEYRVGIRSWLLPLLLVPPMALGLWLDPNGTLPLVLAQAMMACLSLSCVIFAAKIGLRHSKTHGLLAGFIIATWFEFVYFGGKTLTESAALAAFMPAAYFLTQPGLDGPTGRRSLILAGFLMGLCFLLRFQLGPALFTLVAIIAGRDWRNRWLPIVIGGSLALLLGGAVDLAMGGLPFRWLIENVRINIYEGRAQRYGVSPATFYIALYGLLYFAALPFIVILVRLGQRRYPALLAAAVVNLIAHSLIAHKEYRFVILSSLIIMLLAALGMADAIKYLGDRRPQLRRILIPATLALSAAVSATLATTRFAWGWSAYRPVITLVRMAGDRPELCAFATPSEHWWLGTNYVNLQRKVPILLLDDQDFSRLSQAYNAAFVSPAQISRLPATFQKLSCGMMEDTPVCLYWRPGPCRGDARAYHANAVLRRRNE